MSNFEIITINILTELSKIIEDTEKKTPTILGYLNIILNIILLILSIIYIYITFNNRLSNSTKNLSNIFSIIAFSITIFCYLIIARDNPKNFSIILNYKKIIVDYIFYTLLLVYPIFLLSLIMTYNNIINCANPGKINSKINNTQDEKCSSENKSSCNRSIIKYYFNFIIPIFIVISLFIYLLLYSKDIAVNTKKFMKNSLLFFHSLISPFIIFSINLYILISFTNILVNFDNNLCNNIISTSTYNKIIAIFCTIFILILFSIYYLIYPYIANNGILSIEYTSNKLLSLVKDIINVINQKINDISNNIYNST